MEKRTLHCLWCGYFRIERLSSSLNVCKSNESLNKQRTAGHTWTKCTSLLRMLLSQTDSSNVQRDLCSWQHFPPGFNILGLILDRENWSNIPSVSVFWLDFNQTWKTNLALTQNRRQPTSHLVFNRGLYVCAGLLNILKLYKNFFDL